MAVPVFVRMNTHTMNAITAKNINIPVGIERLTSMTFSPTFTVSLKFSESQSFKTWSQ